MSKQLSLSTSNLYPIWDVPQHERRYRLSNRFSAIVRGIVIRLNTVNRFLAIGHSGFRYARVTWIIKLQCFTRTQSKFQIILFFNTSNFAIVYIASVAVKNYPSVLQFLGDRLNHFHNAYSKSRNTRTDKMNFSSRPTNDENEAYYVHRGTI